MSQFELSSPFRTDVPLMTLVTSENEKHVLRGFSGNLNMEVSRALVRHPTEDAWIAGDELQFVLQMSGRLLGCDLYSNEVVSEVVSVPVKDDIFGYRSSSQRYNSANCSAPVFDSLREATEACLRLQAASPDRSLSGIFMAADHVYVWDFTNAANANADMHFYALHDPRCPCQRKHAESTAVKLVVP